MLVTVTTLCTFTRPLRGHYFTSYPTKRLTFLGNGNIVVSTHNFAEKKALLEGKKFTLKTKFSQKKKKIQLLSNVPHTDGNRAAGRLAGEINALHKVRVCN